VTVKFDSINQAHREFITNQHIFFIGSAKCEGLSNVSPKEIHKYKEERNQLSLNDKTTHILENS